MCRDSTSFNIQGGILLREELVSVHELVYRTSLAAHQTGLQPEESTPLTEVSAFHQAGLGLLQVEFQWMGSHQLW